MKRLLNILIAVAAAAFLTAILARLFGRSNAFGFQLHTIWRFSAGCLLFAISFILMQIRDKK